MAKKTKRPRAPQVTTRFKQNTKRRSPGPRKSAGGATPSGRTQGEFDPDQNVRQVEEPMPEPAMPEPAAATPLATDTMDQDRFASAGRSIQRFPDDTV